MNDPSMPCEDCEQGLSSCCRIVRAVDIEDMLPSDCWIFASSAPIPGEGIMCATLIGARFSTGAKWTEAMCCLPCRIRLVIERTATIP